MSRLVARLVLFARAAGRADRPNNASVLLEWDAALAQNDARLRR